MFDGNIEEICEWFMRNIKNVRVEKYDIAKTDDGSEGHFNRDLKEFDLSGVKRVGAYEYRDDDELRILFNSGLQITFVKENEVEPRIHGENAHNF